MQIVEMFLANGADASVQGKGGTTAAQVARARGFDRAAELLEAPARILPPDARANA